MTSPPSAGRSPGSSAAKATPALFAEQGFSHVLLDAKLQDMDGLALARQARQMQPRAWVFLISAYYYRDDPDIARALAEDVIHGFIPKPFTHLEIMASVIP